MLEPLSENHTLNFINIHNNNNKIITLKLLFFFVVMAKQTYLFGVLVSPLSKRLCLRDSDKSDDKTQKFKKSWKEATSWPKVANASHSLSAALPTTWLKLVEEGMMCLLCEKYNKNKSAPSGKEI